MSFCQGHLGEIPSLREGQPPRPGRGGQTLDVTKPQQKADDELGKQRALIETINQAYENDPPTTEERELLQGIRERQRRLLESDR